MLNSLKCSFSIMGAEDEIARKVVSFSVPLEVIHTSEDAFCPSSGHYTVSGGKETIPHVVFPDAIENFKFVSDDDVLFFNIGDEEVLWFSKEDYANIDSVKKTVEDFLEDWCR